MVQHLTSVFTVLLAMDDTPPSLEGTTPRALAEASTTECFARTDTDRDGRVSLAEFWSFYSSALAAYAESPPAATASPVGDDMDDAYDSDVGRGGSKSPRSTTASGWRTILWLAGLAVGSVPFATAKAVLSRCIDPRSRTITAARFRRAMVHFARPEATTEDFVRAADGVFDWFCDVAGAEEEDETGAPVMADIQAWLLLSDLTANDIAGSGAAFAAFDADGDGFLDRGDLRRSLMQDGISMPAAPAAAAADIVVEEGDFNMDGKLSRGEFALWCQGDGDEEDEDNSEHEEKGVEGELSPRRPLHEVVLRAGLKAARLALAFLAAVPIETVGTALMRHSDALTDVLDVDGFLAACQVGWRKAGNPSAAMPASTARVLRWLFQLLDGGDQGVVEWHRAAAGLTALSGTSGEERATYLAALFTTDTDHLTYSQLVQLLEVELTVQTALGIGSLAWRGLPVPPCEFAQAAADCVMRRLTPAQRRSAEVPVAAFMEWYTPRSSPDALRSAVAAVLSIAPPHVHGASDSGSDVATPTQRRRSTREAAQAAARRRARTASVDSAAAAVDANQVPAPSAPAAPRGTGHAPMPSVSHRRGSSGVALPAPTAPLASLASVELLRGVSRGKEDRKARRASVLRRLLSVGVATDGETHVTDAVAKLSCLGTLPVLAAFSVFAAASHDGRTLSHAAFLKALAPLLAPGVNPADRHVSEVLAEFVSVLDLQKEGCVTCGGWCVMLCRAKVFVCRLQAWQGNVAVAMGVSFSSQLCHYLCFPAFLFVCPLLFGGAQLDRARGHRCCTDGPVPWLRRRPGRMLVPIDGQRRVVACRHAAFPAPDGGAAIHV